MTLSPNNSPLDIFRSPCFWAGVCAWLAAQVAKMLCARARTGRIDFQYLLSLGGMPSAHSAMASGLATAVGLQVGFGSVVFVITLAFAIVVMFDAATVRRAAGAQARLLNEIIEELRTHHRVPERKLAELLGHTRLEVFMGMLIGVLVGILVVAVAAIR